MTKCEIIKDLLPLYVDGICSDESKEFVKKHVDNCQDCKKTLSILKHEEIEEIITEDTRSVIENKIKKDARRPLIIAIAISITFFVTILLLMLVNWKYNGQMIGESGAVRIAISFSVPGILYAWALFGAIRYIRYNKFVKYGVFSMIIGSFALFGRTMFTLLLGGGFMLPKFTLFNDWDFAGGDNIYWILFIGFMLLGIILTVIGLRKGRR